MAGRMRIGIVTTWFERGAAYVSRQYRRVLEKEHTVFIYARGGEERAASNPEWDDERVTWGKLPVVPLAHSVELNDFAGWVKRNALDIVFFNEQHWWEPVILCASLGVIAGSYVDYYTEQTVPLFGCYDFLICNTRRHYSVFDWHPQSFYVPWGTEVNVFQPQTLEPVEPGKVVFFHSAGMNPVRKGTDLLIEAFAAVAGPARLVIHTQMDVGSLFPRLRTKLDDLRKHGRIEYIEKSVPAPGLYHLGDV
ncbi:MAG TPA: hypothetical protein VGF16_08690, partial [Bryobacteraceae bacterium]